MDVALKFNKDFERTLKTLVDEFGEDFEILNGIHSSQLNFSDFIDSFVDKNVNDVTIDNNITMSIVADRLGIVPQQLNNKFNNSRLALSELNEWLHCIGYELQIEFVPIEQSEK